MKGDRDHYDGRRPTPDRRRGAGRDKGEFHATRSKPLAPRRKGAHSPRGAASFDDQTFERLAWLAEAKRVPIASIIRIAVEVYVSIVRSKADAEKIAALQRAKLNTESI